ncbi:MAG: DUF1549 domain-containing protein, partial [Gemmataceae bacterium]|nr:DUF1549 domain-containing protein [Gemmataceae bacterium]
MRTLLTLACALCPALAHAADPKVDFARDVRPILAGQCFQCHGPDEKTRKAKLRLDVRDDALKAGAFVPGKPDQSELIRRICADEPDLRMPPAKAKKPPLTDAQLATLKKWIADGAAYSDHWAFAPLKRPEIPNTKAQAAHPIDAFVLARLEKEGVPPAKEADRAALIRRLSLD